MSNIKNNRWLSIITIILLIANIVTLILLWNNKKNERDDQQRRPALGAVFEFVSKELQFDSLQREAYGKLRDEHQAGQRSIKDSIRKVKDAFFALLSQSDVADSVVQAAARKASETELQLEVLTFRHFQKVRALCNPDQQKKFDSIIQDVLRRMAPRKGRQGPPPGGRGEGPESQDKFPPPPGTEKGPPPPQH